MRETLSIPLIHRLLIIAKKTLIFKLRKWLKLLWNRGRGGGSPFLEIVHNCCEIFFLFWWLPYANAIFLVKLMGPLNQIFWFALLLIPSSKHDLLQLHGVSPSSSGNFFIFCPVLRDSDETDVHAFVCVLCQHGNGKWWHCLKKMSTIRLFNDVMLTVVFLYVS